MDEKSEEKELNQLEDQQITTTDSSTINETKNANDHAANIFTPFLNQDLKNQPSKIMPSYTNEGEPINEPTTEGTERQFHALLSEIESEIHDGIEDKAPTALSSPPKGEPENAEEIHYEESYVGEELLEKESVKLKRKKKASKNQPDVVHLLHSGTIPSKLGRGASYASIGGVEKTMQPKLTRGSTAPGNSHRRAKSNNTSGEEGVSSHPLTVYHSELIEGKYERSVIVSILVPEKYLKTDHGSRSNSPKNREPTLHLDTNLTNENLTHNDPWSPLVPPNSSRIGRMSRQPTRNSVASSFEQNDFGFDGDNEDLRSASSASSGGYGVNNLRSTSQGSIAGLTPNKRMKYFIVKVNDLITSREASYTVILRDFQALLEESMKEYSTADVEEFFQPYQLFWWKKHLNKVVLVYDKPNGSLSIIIDKKLIKKHLKKKMEHFFWMKDQITSSYQSYEEEKVKTVNSRLEQVNSSKKFPRNPMNSPKASSNDESYDDHSYLVNFDESKVQLENKGLQESHTTISILSPAGSKKQTPTRKSVDFSLLPSPKEETEISRENDHALLRMNEDDENLTESAKRRNSRTILKQSQSRSEKIIHKEGSGIHIDSNTNLTNSVDAHEEGELAIGEEGFSPSGKYKTRNSGISKSMPDITTLQRLNSQKSQLPIEPSGSQISTKGSSKKHVHVEVRKKSKQYHPKLSDKSTELLMVAYGRPKDHTHGGVDRNKSSDSMEDEGSRLPVGKTPRVANSAKNTTRTKAKVGGGLLITVKTKADSNAPTSESMNTHFEQNRPMSELTVDSSVEFISSPYESPKNNRIKSPKSQRPSSKHKPSPSKELKLPAITTNQPSPSTSGSRFPNFSPKSVFRIANPYSFAYTQLHEEMKSGNNRPLSSSNPLSPVDLPPIQNFSRPLSPIQQITHHIILDTNFNSHSPSAREVIGENSSIYEDSYNNSTVESVNASPDPLTLQQKQLPSQYTLKPVERPVSPFEMEVRGLKGSAKVAADIIKKARRQENGDVKFQVRKVSQTEMKLLQSPFAKKLYYEPKETNFIQKLLSTDSEQTANRSISLSVDQSKGDWNSDTHPTNSSSRPLTQKAVKRSSMK